MRNRVCFPLPLNYCAVSQMIRSANSRFTARGYGNNSAGLRKPRLRRDRVRTRAHQTVFVLLIICSISNAHSIRI